MHDHIVPKLPKWPFFLGDALLLGLAGYICFQTKSPLGQLEIIASVACVAIGSGLGILPFLSEYRAGMKVAQAENLAGAVAKIQNLEQVATQISSATNHWQTAQDAADKTSRSAKEIADGMATELKNFNEFMQRADASEKAALRLEVEKGRRAEGEWLQILVRILDHVFALHAGALRSGQPGLVKQIDLFQNSCRDAVRRVGLIPFVAAPGEKFDGQRHQLVEETTPATEAAVVEETLATGYTYQGQLLRPAMVKLQNVPVAEPDTTQHQLPLETA